MRFFKTLMTVVLAVAPCLAQPAFSGSTSASEGKTSQRLVIGGTGSGLAIIRKLGDAFAASHHGAVLFVPPSLGSGGGIKALAAGKLDLSISARALKPKEKVLGLKELLFVDTPVVFASRELNGQENITLKYLEKAYAGQMPSWPNGERLRIILRPQGESDTKILKSLSAQMAANLDHIYDNRNIHVAARDQDNAQALSKVPGSLGLISLGQLMAEHWKMSVLTYEGVTPSPDALASGEYPLIKTLRLIAPDAPSLQANKFLEFLTGTEAQKILRTHGYLPHELTIEAVTRS